MPHLYSFQRLGDYYYEESDAKTRNNLALITIKAAFVILIPYYWTQLIFNNPPNPQDITNVVVGTWSPLFPGNNFEPPAVIPIWYYNQIIFTLILILPLLEFAFFFHNRINDRTTISAAAISILLAVVSEYLLTPDYMVEAMNHTPYEILPSVVSLSIFVFVFWPLLKNSRTFSQDSMHIYEKRVTLSRIETTLKELVPAKTTFLIWISMILLPSLLNINSMSFSDTNNQYYFQVSGEVWSASYYNQWTWSVPGLFLLSGYSILRVLTVAWASPWTLTIWILSLWLGITTLQFIDGKSTMKQVRLLAVILILLNVISALILMTDMLMSTAGFYLIPLPFYPISALLIAKFAHSPVPKSLVDEEMIYVPLRTRIASSLKLRKTNNKIIETEKCDEKDNCSIK